MSATLTSESLARMLHHGASRLLDNHDLLSRLDAATGDGDHGTTMKKVAAAIQEAAAAPAAGIAPLLDAVGWAVLSVDGGSISPLLGSFFLGMAEVAPAEGPAVAPRSPPPSRPVWPSCRRRRRRNRGTRRCSTPWSRRCRRCAGPRLRRRWNRPWPRRPRPRRRGPRRRAACRHASVGRRNLGARTVGQVDPGATSVALLFAGLRDGLLASV